MTLIWSSSAGALALQSPTTNDPLLDMNTQPSLDLQFSASKTLDDQVSGQNLITFSRSTTGTYVDSSGVIQTAAIDAPRFDHDPVTGESLGLLIEESRTNLLTYSEDFDDGAYIKDAGVSVTADSITSPSGSISADLVSVTDSGRIYANNTSVTGVCSVYIKAGTFSHFSMLGCFVDLTVPSTTAGSLVDAGNGWYQVISEQRTSSRHFQVQAYPDNTYITHSTAGTYYLWGAQLEEGSFPTSYIPTSGSTVTRAADVASITGTNFSRWYNQSEGTIYSESYEVSGASWRANYLIKAGDSNTRIQEVNNRFYIGASFVNLPTSATPNQKYKVAFGLGSQPQSATSDGQPVVTLNLAVSQEIDTLGLGDLGGIGGTFGSGHISRFTYYPYRLGDTKLQEITS